MPEVFYLEVKQQIERGHRMLKAAMKINILVEPA
jgi:hypothetical protein